MVQVHGGFRRVCLLLHLELLILLSQDVRLSVHLFIFTSLPLLIRYGHEGASLEDFFFQVERALGRFGPSFFFFLFFFKRSVSARTNLIISAYLSNSISTRYLEKEKNSLMTYFFAPFLNLIHLQFYVKQITNYIFLIYIESSPENFHQYICIQAMTMSNLKITVENNRMFDMSSRQ